MDATTPTQSPHRWIQAKPFSALAVPRHFRGISGLVVLAVVATGLAVAATPAAGDHIESWNNGDIKRDAHQLIREGNWWQGEGGGTGSDPTSAGRRPIFGGVGL